MKTTILFLMWVLLAGCSAQTDEPSVSPAERDAPPPPRVAGATPPTHIGTPATASTRATATGVVTAIDGSARKITIAHEPVPALEWPAMTMGFSAGDVDLADVQVGDKVAFEFTTEGMNAAITRIDRQ